MGFIAQELNEAAKTNAQKSLISKDIKTKLKETDPEPDNSDPLLLISIDGLIPEIVGCIKHMSLQNTYLQSQNTYLQIQTTSSQIQNTSIQQQVSTMQTELSELKIQMAAFLAKLSM